MADENDEQEELEEEIPEEHEPGEFDYLGEPEGDDDEGDEKRSKGKELTKTDDEREPKTPQISDEDLALVRRLRTDPKGVLEEVLGPLANRPTQQPVTQEAPAFLKDPDKFARDISTKLLTDQEGAIKDLIGAAKEYGEYQSRRTDSAVGATNRAVVEGAIDQYMERIKGDKSLDPEVAVQMDAIIKDAIRQNGDNIYRQPVSAVIQALNNTKEQAIGRAYIKNGEVRRPNSARSAKPPNYGSSIRRGKQLTESDMPRTEAERELVRGYRASGLFTNKEIIENLKQFRAEQNETPSGRRRRAG